MTFTANPKQIGFAAGWCSQMKERTLINRNSWPQVEFGRKLFVTRESPLGVPLTQHDFFSVRISEIISENFWAEKQKVGVIVCIQCNASDCIASI